MQGGIDRAAIVAPGVVEQAMGQFPCRPLYRLRSHQTEKGVQAGKAQSTLRDDMVGKFFASLVHHHQHQIAERTQIGTRWRCPHAPARRPLLFEPVHQRVVEQEQIAQLDVGAGQPPLRMLERLGGEFVGAKPAPSAFLVGQDAARAVQASSPGVSAGRRRMTSVTR